MGIFHCHVSLPEGIFLREKLYLHNSAFTPWKPLLSFFFASRLRHVFLFLFPFFFVRKRWDSLPGGSSFLLSIPSIPKCSMYGIFTYIFPLFMWPFFTFHVGNPYIRRIWDIVYKELHNTLPETNIAPENRVSQKESSIPTIHLQGLC